MYVRVWDLTLLTAKQRDDLKKKEDELLSSANIAEADVIVIGNKRSTATPSSHSSSQYEQYESQSYGNREYDRGKGYARGGGREHYSSLNSSA